MTNEILITHIGYLYNEHKKYAIRLQNKLAYGISCLKDEINFINVSYIIQELENYFLGCSCLTVDDICFFIKKAKELIK
jgi:hypothetical protein